MTGVDASPAWIFNGQRWQAEPVFHLALPWEDGGHFVALVELEPPFAGLERVEHRTITRCGRVLSEWSWKRDPRRHGVRTEHDHRERDHAFSLRRDHAETIGRPCWRCRAAEVA